MNKKIFAIIIGLVAIIAIVLVSQLFNVKSVEVVCDDASVVALESDSIIELSDIQLGQNILTIDEKVAKATIEQAYGNIIKVAKIERNLPNKVVIHLAVRDLLFAVRGIDGDTIERYATDREFQVNSLKESTSVVSIDYDELIAIDGVMIAGSYNVRELKNIRNIISVFTTLGYDNAALKAFIKSIEVRGNDYVIHLRAYTGTTIVLTAGVGDLQSTISAKLDAFYAKEDADRYGKTL